MQVTDGNKFRNVIRGMSRMYGSDPDKLVLDAYWIALSDWDFESFQQAAALLMRTNKFMPKPSDFNELRNAGKPTAGEAWALVLDRVRKGAVRWQGGGVSLYSHFAPPEGELITAAVEAIGGYKAIAMHDEATLHFLEKRFCDHYEAIQDKREIRAAVPEIAQTPEWLRLKLEEAQKRLTQS